ncbi:MULTISPECIES: PD-(D/E)XK nuclease family protein [Bacillus cereus group]|uniref:PD-(D/E)XK endonuclease-like domain-containing protein n=1 Tax=Bacillus thuringiensis TaxID=1428 RepID=A0A9W3SD84_BACTU|nr:MULTISPECIES: PD-(D/E)XK nuclease family protein [Bacillus cereus group]ANS49303.1 hypothetical protein BT246_39570 [Bacillus thuringiensis]MBH0335499.1 hypothetical protein [Bacillus thuringiensis]MBJ8024538.1 PD-(D/E)XK nuclease family protein [Bacillus cereus]MBJ8036947.1 PD-(D/E)XK nuclease family protein [Bacillus cereus]
MERGPIIEHLFQEQLDKYYASPSSGFHDEHLIRKFYEQKLRHLAWKPYPKDGLVTFGASGTDKCDREIVFKHGGTKVQKSEDIPFRGRQRRAGNSVVDFTQLDLVHMEKRLKEDALFTIPINESGDWMFEDAVQTRKVFEYDGVKFAITAKPDGILRYEGDLIIFEYKTKATGIREMNGKLDFKGPQADHLRQVTAESLVFGIKERILLYESLHKPAWFSDEDNKSVPKTRKTWLNGEPVPDTRAFYSYVTDEAQEELLADLARQAKLIYAGQIPEMTVEMTGKCGFCPYSEKCKANLTEDEIRMLRELEERYTHSSLAGKSDHRNLVSYLEGVSFD